MSARPDDTLRIRPARPDDAAEAAALLSASITKLCITDHQNDEAILRRWAGEKTVDNIRRLFSTPGNHPLIAERDGLMVGVCLLDDSGEVVLNYVAPHARFTGVSRAMLAALEELASQRYLSALQLTSTSTARGFYLSGGFTEQTPNETWTGVGTSVFPMFKQLDAAEPD